MSDIDSREGRFNPEALIELVRPHRFLYDNREACFKDVQMKENRWALIGKELGISGELAARKFQHLRDRWRRLKNIQDGAKKSGSGAPDIPKISWRFFPVMDSLMAKQRLGTVISNLDIEPDNADISVSSGVWNIETAECSTRESDQDFADDCESSFSVPPTTSHRAAPKDVEIEPAAPTIQNLKRTSSVQHKSKKQRTKDANEDDIKQVTGAFMQAVSATSQRQPVHRCDSFFDFMAASAKELKPFEQDRLMHACHMALLEIKEV